MHIKLQDVNQSVSGSSCVREYSHTYSSLTTLFFFFSFLKQKLTSFAFPVHPSVAAAVNHIASGRKAERLHEFALNLQSDPSSRRSRLTVSAIRSSFVITGVPDWHKKKQNQNQNTRASHASESHSGPPCDTRVRRHARRISSSRRTDRGKLGE